MICGKHFRSYLVGSFSALGGFLFGYHTGVISGVLTMKDFLNMTHINVTGKGTADTTNFRIGLIVGILLFGCILGSLMGGQMSDRFSRKYSISFFSFIFTISAGMQILREGLVLLVIARFFAGISIGALSMIVPIYHSEIAATKVRGRIITFQQWAITFGIAISFWVNYGTNSSGMKGHNLEWQLPLGFQMVPSFILAIGILFCPFSPRWLINHDREDEAKGVLMKIRSASDDEIEAEMNRIKNEVAYLRENEIDSYGQLFHVPLRRPFLLGVGIQILQQLTGINATIYYAPTIFQLFINDSSVPGNHTVDILHYPLITTGIYGIVNFLFTIPTMILIDKLGRRILLIIGAIVMSISMFTACILVDVYVERNCTSYSDFCIYTINYEESPHISVIIIILIYLFAAGFAFSWGPIPWIYCTEIFPVTMRAKASSLTTAANWTTNCLVSFLVPRLLYQIYYKTFIIFAIFCTMMIGIIYFLYPETKNIHLEENTTIEISRIFVPQWLEIERNSYHTFQQQPSFVNETNVPAVTDQHSINQANQINHFDTAIETNNHHPQEPFGDNDTVN